MAQGTLGDRRGGGGALVLTRRRRRETRTGRKVEGRRERGLMELWCLKLLLRC